MTTIEVQVPEGTTPEDVEDFFRRGYGGYRSEWEYAEIECPKKYMVTIGVNEVALSRRSRIPGYTIKWKMAGSDEVCDGMPAFEDKERAQSKADEIAGNIKVITRAWVEEA